MKHGSLQLFKGYEIADDRLANIGEPYHVNMQTQRHGYVAHME
jgi:hypothetical protein